MRYWMIGRRFCTMCIHGQLDADGACISVLQNDIADPLYQFELAARASEKQRLPTFAT